MEIAVSVRGGFGCWLKAPEALFHLAIQQSAAAWQYPFCRTSVPQDQHIPCCNHQRYFNMPLPF